jgi:hypothetical protein
MKYGSEIPILFSFFRLHPSCFLARTNNRHFKKVSDARRANFDELKRTLQYVEASRTSATTQVSLFQQPAKE